MLQVAPALPGLETLRAATAPALAPDFGEIPSLSCMSEVCDSIMPSIRDDKVSWLLTSAGSVFPVYLYI